MLLNDYSVRIVGGNEVAGGYVEMQHGQTFQIALRNNNGRRCDARVEMNGIEVGTWRLNAYSSANLTRPEEGDGNFTFYRVGSQESYLVQAQGGEQAAGLVVVTFTPEVHRVSSSWIATSATTSAASYGSFSYTGAMKGISEDAYTLQGAFPAEQRSAGVIGQSGHSSQVYGTAENIEYDYSGRTVISLRLIAANDTGPRPLTQRSNPVPPPVR